jgi:hypothetical protein
MLAFVEVKARPRACESLSIVPIWSG